MYLLKLSRRCMSMLAQRSQESQVGKIKRIRVQDVGPKISNIAQARSVGEIVRITISKIKLKSKECVRSKDQDFYYIFTRQQERRNTKDGHKIEDSSILC